MDKKLLEDIIKDDCSKNGLTTKNLCTDVANLIPTDEYKNLKELFIVLEVTDCNPVVIKCPVVETSWKYITINVKNRYKDHDEISENGAHSFITKEYYNNLKIDKKDINKNYKYRASTTYSRALAYLLLTNQTRILNNLREANDIQLYERYVIASKIDLVYGLEYIARYLKMDYLFRLDDDTILIPEKEEEMV